MIQLTTLRKGATATAIRGGFSTSANLVVEALAAGRVTSLSPRKDLSLRPGVIYRAHTGIQIVTPRFNHTAMVVRATPEMWRYGVRVERVDELDGELTICFSTVEPFQLSDQENQSVSFEVHVFGVTGMTSVELTAGGERAEPGIKLALEKPTAHIKAIPVPAAPAAQKQAAKTPEQEAKAVSDWLNAPDETGHVVSKAAPVEITTEAAPAATSSLSKGLTAAIEGI